jgi:hypothetical protein
LTFFGILVVVDFAVRKGLWLGLVSLQGGHAPLIVSASWSWSWSGLVSLYGVLGLNLSVVGVTGGVKKFFFFFFFE